MLHENWAIIEFSIVSAGARGFGTDFSKEPARSRQVAAGMAWFAEQHKTYPYRGIASAPMAFLTGNGVVINGKLLHELTADESRHYTALGMWKGVRLYNFLNPHFQERAVEYIKFERRSERERLVAKRTLQIFEWLQAKQLEAFSRRESEAVV